MYTSTSPDPISPFASSVHCPQLTPSTVPSNYIYYRKCPDCQITSTYTPRSRRVDPIICCKKQYFGESEFTKTYHPYHVCWACDRLIHGGDPWAAPPRAYGGCRQPCDGSELVVWLESRGETVVWFERSRGGDREVDMDEVERRRRWGNRMVNMMGEEEGDGVCQGDQRFGGW